MRVGRVAKHSMASLSLWETLSDLWVEFLQANRRDLWTWPPARGKLPLNVFVTGYRKDMTYGTALTGQGSA